MYVLSYRELSMGGGEGQDGEMGNREYKVRMAMKTKEDEYAKTQFFRYDHFIK